jgi:riboflavin synthase alpha subunit
MFTGIIRDQGTIEALATHPEHVVTIRSPFTAELRPGDSVAVQGVCLTVLNTEKETWRVRLMEETLSRTTLGQLRQGDMVNLERPLRADQLFDGHLVQGHVDGTATVIGKRLVGEDCVLTLRAPEALAPLLVPKGSVALDGVSLTVVDVAGADFSVSLMPYTLEHTTLGQLAPGMHSNLEADVIGKYVHRYLAAATAPAVRMPAEYQHP